MVGVTIFTLKRGLIKGRHSLKGPILIVLLITINSYFSRAETIAADAQPGMDFETSGLSSQPLASSEVTQSWQGKDVEDKAPGIKVLLKKKRADEQYANQVYVINEARFLSLDFFTINTGNPELDLQYEKLVLGSRFNNTKCGDDLTKILQLLAENTESMKNQKRYDSINDSEGWSLRLESVMNSFGTFEPGSMSGREFMVGSYDQCVDSQLQLEENLPEVLTSTKHCWAKLNLDKRLNESLNRPEKSHNEGISIKVGICIPEACHSQSFTEYKTLFEKLIYHRFKLPKESFNEEYPEVMSIFCPPEEDSPYRKLPISGKILIATSILWFSLVIHCTYTNQKRTIITNNIARNRQQPKESSHISYSLCLKQSWKDFILENENPRETERIDLNTLNPIKVFGCIIVVWGHSILVHLSISPNLLIAFQKFDNNPFMTANYCAANMVDSLFVISGILVSMIALRHINGYRQDKLESRLDKMKLYIKVSSYLSITRYLRLVPLYFLTHWFKKSLTPRLGSGPFWDHGLNKDTMEGSCQHESWLIPFTAWAAYMPLSRQCLPVAWSFANDIHFAIFLSPIIVILSKKPRLAGLISAVMFVLSTKAILNAIGEVDQDLKIAAANLRIHGITQIFKLHSLLYTAPHYRSTSILIGCFAGYVLQCYNEGKINRWPRWFTGFATKLSFSFIILYFSLFIIVPLTRTSHPEDRRVLEFLYTHANTTFRTLWCLANTVVFLRMVTDWKDNPLMQMCAGKFWKIVAKLNYAILLIHVDVISVLHHSTTSCPEYSVIELLKSFSCAYLLCIMLGPIIHVCIENPMDKLIRGYVKSFADKGLPNEKSRQLQRREDCTDRKAKKL